MLSARCLATCRDGDRERQGQEPEEAGGGDSLASGTSPVLPPSLRDAGTADAGGTALGSRSSAFGADALASSLGGGASKGAAAAGAYSVDRAEFTSHSKAGSSESAPLGGGGADAAAHGTALGLPQDTRWKHAAAVDGGGGGDGDEPASKVAPPRDSAQAGVLEMGRAGSGSSGAASAGADGPSPSGAAAAYQLDGKAGAAKNVTLGAARASGGEAMATPEAAPAAGGRAGTVSSADETAIRASLGGGPPAQTPEDQKEKATRAPSDADLAPGTSSRSSSSSKGSDATSSSPPAKAAGPSAGVDLSAAAAVLEGEMDVGEMEMELAFNSNPANNATTTTTQGSAAAVSTPAASTSAARTSAKSSGVTSGAWS